MKSRLATTADVNSEDTDGQTPLILAAINGHDKVVKLLLENNVDADDKARSTAVQLTALKVKQMVEQLLIAEGPPS